MIQQTSLRTFVTLADDLTKLGDDYENRPKYDPNMQYGYPKFYGVGRTLQISSLQTQVFARAYREPENCQTIQVNFSQIWTPIGLARATYRLVNNQLIVEEYSRIPSDTLSVSLLMQELIGQAPQRETLGILSHGYTVYVPGNNEIMFLDSFLRDRGSTGAKFYFSGTRDGDYANGIVIRELPATQLPQRQ